MENNYYLKRKNKLVKKFEKKFKWLNAPLKKRYGDETANEILNISRTEYINFFPDIPYIGGSKNRWTSNLLEAVELLALYKSMKSLHINDDEFGEVIHEGMQIRLNRYPGILLKILGWSQFTTLFKNKLKKQAIESQKKEFADNFVAFIVDGDGIEYDWGIDFTECAISKFYKRHNAISVLSHICKLDYYLSEAFGLGMIRTKTIADGDEKCNTRLKYKRKTEFR